MTFHDEIVKLQERVKALEDGFETLKPTDPTAPEPTEPDTITPAYLDTLTEAQVGDLYVRGRINEAELGGAAIRRAFPDLQKPEPVAVVEPEPVASEPAQEAPAAEDETPAVVDDAQIAAQNEHDRATGNVNEAGQTPYEAVEAEAAAPVAEDAGLES